MSWSLPAACRRRFAARLEQRLAQALELLMLRMQRAEIGVRLLRRRDLGQDLLRIAQRRRLIEQIAELGRIEAPAAGETRIFQEREVELDLGGGLRVGILGQLPCAGSSKAAAAKPQSSALPISKIAACPLAVNPISVIHSGPLRWS